MARGKRFSEDQRAQWVARWRASGMTAVEFGQEHKLAVSTVYAWARGLNLSTDKPLAFTQLRLADTKSRPTAVVEFVLPNGVVVRLCGDIDPPRLRAMLEVARSC